MQRDRQVILVGRPQFLEQHLGLAARIDEEQRRAVFSQLPVDVGNGVSCRMAGPGNVLVGRKDRNVGLRAALNRDQPGLMLPARFLRHQPSPQIHRLGDGRREADGLEIGCQPPQPRKAERQHVAAFRRDQRMQLVEDHVFEILEETLRLAVRQKQRHLLRRRQQDVGRRELLALALGRRRVAGAVLDGDRQSHLGHRAHQVALDIDGERLQRRDIERVDAAKGRSGRNFSASGEFDQRRQEAGERLARAGRCDQQRAFARLGARQQLQLMVARLPALFREPAQEGGGQGYAAFDIDLIHAGQCSSKARIEKR